MSSLERELEKGHYFSVDLKDIYMKKLKHVLLSSSIDISDIPEDSYLLQKVVGSLIGEEFNPLSEEGKELRKNLEKI